MSKYKNMNQKIKEHLEAICEREGWETTDDSLVELVTESDAIFEETVSEHRWYNTDFIVVDVEGMLIGYFGYSGTGDGWQDSAPEIDVDDFVEVEAKEKTVIYYEPINNKIG